MEKINSFVVQGINIVAGIVLTLLGLRFVLKLFGANPANEFVEWIYETSRQLVEPFFGIFPAPRFEDGFILELSTLFAIIIYTIVAMLLVALVEWLMTAGADHNATRQKRTR